jgi:carbonic anhydrase
MQEIIEGIRAFHQDFFEARIELFRQLAHGQSPPYLFITCSDSRIDPTLITNTDPGQLFVVRNAGNIVPPQAAGISGEAAAVEFGVVALKVQHIIVCGHSHCGAMGAILHPEHLSNLPTVANFLVHAEKVRKIVKHKYPGRSGDDQVLAAAKENALVQLDNLRTLPSVAAAQKAGQLQLHAWVYVIETGEVHAYDPASKQYQPLGSPVAVTE